MAYKNMLIRLRPTTPECPRCAELRGRTVRMSKIMIGKVPTAYECPSCDYVISLQTFSDKQSDQHKA